MFQNLHLEDLLWKLQKFEDLSQNLHLLDDAAKAEKDLLENELSEIFKKLCMKNRPTVEEMQGIVKELEKFAKGQVHDGYHAKYNLFMEESITTFMKNYDSLLARGMQESEATALISKQFERFLATIKTQLESGKMKLWN